MRFLSALMPREARFFKLFARHAELVAAGGRATTPRRPWVASGYCWSPWWRRSPTGRAGWSC